MRRTIPILFWEMGLYPKDQWEMVGYEYAGGNGIPTSVEIQRRKDEKDNYVVPDGGYAHQLFK